MHLQVKKLKVHEGEEGMALAGYGDRGTSQ